MAQIFVGILPKVAQVHFSIHILDEDDVRRILDGVFADPKVQMALNRLLAEKRGPVPMTDGAAAATVDDEQE